MVGRPSKNDHESFLVFWNADLGDMPIGGEKALFGTTAKLSVFMVFAVISVLVSSLTASFASGLSPRPSLPVALLSRARVRRAHRRIRALGEGQSAARDVHGRD